jgi:hypothetical protein
LLTLFQERLTLLPEEFAIKPVGALKPALTVAEA